MSAKITVIPKQELVLLFEDQIVKHTVGGSYHVVRVLEYLCRQLGIVVDEFSIADHLPGDWTMEQYQYASRRAESQRHRASSKYDLHEHFDAIDWLALLDKCYYRCVACGGAWHDYNALTVDHIVPLSAGGPNTVDNLQPLCDESGNDCHRRKEAHYQETGECIDYRKRLPYWEVAP